MSLLDQEDIYSALGFFLFSYFKFSSVDKDSDSTVGPILCNQPYMTGAELATTTLLTDFVFRELYSMPMPNDTLIKPNSEGLCIEQSSEGI